MRAVLALLLSLLTSAAMAQQTSPLTIPKGGTNAATASQARTNLGLTIGSAVEAWNAQLDCLAALGTTGIIRRTGAGTCSGGATVVVAEGGTGAVSLTANALLTGAGTGAINAVPITGLVVGNGASAPTAYAGGTCTNQTVTALSAAGGLTCNSITNSFLASGTFASITGTGTLTAGATGAGFTVNLGASTISGALPAANFPAFSGDVTTSAGSLVTSIAAGAVTNTKLATGTFSNVTGTGTLTAGATGAGFTVALGASTITGTLPAGAFPALTGDVTTTAGALATTIAANAVTNAKLAASPSAATIKGNPTAAAAAQQDFTIAGLTAATACNPSTDFLLKLDAATGTFQKVTCAQIASSSTAGVASLNGLTGALTGADLNILRTVTSGPDTIQTTDCGKTVLEGTGSSGLWTVTLPVASSFDPNCQITVIDGDVGSATTMAGKRLSGFPATMTSQNVLYPGQRVELKIVNGAWTSSNPGRWKNPFGQTKWYVNPSGSDTNDCLATGTTRACATAQAADTRAVYHSDNQGSTPIINMACGVAHSVPLSMGGIPLGTQLVQISPDGNCSFDWFVTGTFAAVTVGDIAELDLNLTYYGSSGSMRCQGNSTNTAFQGGCVKFHGPSVVMDLEGTPTWFPSGSNDDGIFCDGFCQPIIANGITQGAGSGNYVIHMSAGGKMTQSGTISGSTSASANGVFRVFGNAMLITTTATAAAGSWTGGVGTSIIAGNSTYVSNGLSPAGGITLSPSAVGCAALTTNTC